MPEPITVPYPLVTSAQVWTTFAAAALQGLVSQDAGEDQDDELMEANAEYAADYADAMLAEFKARFHHDPAAK